ncbi:MAG: FkbM family methyltransferase [Pseudomonadota bacterium]
MSDQNKEEAQRQYVRAREVIGRGKQAMAEGHRLLRQLSGKIAHARTRGQINQQIWECEKLNGRREMFFSQAGQDAFLDEKIFRGKREGTFVEIGGYDGITGSNCLFFELLRGWRGILIEPSPTFFKQASSFRRATCLQLALADQEGEAEFMDIQEGYSQMSGLTASYDPKLRETVEADPRHKGELITVKTKTLASILEQNFLTEVDYISLDVEGGEMAVLSGFPFDQFKVTAWTIENNTGDTKIPALMRDKGYKRVEALGVDDIYILDSPAE